MLGTCDKCHGPLCVSGQVVCCDRCGHPQPDHPLTANLEPPKPPPEPVIPPQHYASSVPDRVNVLERRAKVTDERLRGLAEDVAKLVHRVTELEQTRAPAPATATATAEPELETVPPTAKPAHGSRRR